MNALCNQVNILNIVAYIDGSLEIKVQKRSLKPIFGVGDCAMTNTNKDIIKTR